MAAEKRTSLNFSVTKNGQTLQQQIALSEDLAGSKLGGVRQSLAAGSWTALNLGTVTVADLLCVVNDDATNFVQLATANDNSGIFSKLTPGRCAFLPVDPAATIYGRANTGACVVKTTTVEA